MFPPYKATLGVMLTHFANMLPLWLPQLLRDMLLLTGQDAGLPSDVDPSSAGAWHTTSSFSMDDLSS